MLDAVIQAALIGGKVISGYRSQADSMNFDRKSASDFVSAADRDSQQAILEFIQKEFPGHAVLAEEEGGGIEGSEYRWIIDPLDGTTNFLHKFPVFAVSVAVEVYNPLSTGFGPIKYAAVFNPVSNDLFTAERGQGAYLNDNKIRVSNPSDFSDALLATGFPFRDREYLEEFLRIFRNMFNGCSGIRRAGSAAQDLCWTASGVLDGFWEKGLSPWDIAAGSLIIEEAGGLVTDFEGGSKYLEIGSVVAGSENIVKQMLTLL